MTRPDLLAGEDMPPPPRQKRSIEARERWKAAGLELFGEHGYERTSIESLAAHSGLAVGGFYQHFRSKRQLLLALMDDLLEGLSQVTLRPSNSDPGDIRAGLRALLGHAFSRDLKYLGAYRAWREASLSDEDLARKQKAIHRWTVARITAVFRALEKMPGARTGGDIEEMARVMDRFFWTLLSEAAGLSAAELNRKLDSATHLIYHALFKDR